MAGIISLCLLTAESVKTLSASAIETSLKAADAALRDARRNLDAAKAASKTRQMGMKARIFNARLHAMSAAAVCTAAQARRTAAKAAVESLRRSGAMISDTRKAELSSAFLVSEKAALAFGNAEREVNRLVDLLRKEEKSGCQLEERAVFSAQSRRDLLLREKGERNSALAARALRKQCVQPAAGAANRRRSDAGAAASEAQKRLLARMAAGAAQ